jgi:hypothetical protein
MTEVDDSAIVTPRKIAWALRMGNRDGVRRLALFVCAASADPTEVYYGCQEQRFMAVEHG